MLQFIITTKTFLTYWRLSNSSVCNFGKIEERERERVFVA